MNKTRRSTLAIALSLASLASQAQDAATIDDALGAYQAGDYAKCADTLTTLQSQVKEMPSGSELFFIECLAAAGRTEAALSYATKGLVEGRISLDELTTKDRPGLNKLRASNAWTPALAKAKALTAEHQASLNQPLRQELLARLEKDQAVRNKVIDEGGDAKAWEQTLRVDKDNAAWLKKVIAVQGWPNESLVGPDGAQAAFLIVQHASFDQSFQEQMLPELKAAVDRGQAKASNWALLTDRVLRQQGKPQIYGTQFQDNEDGSMSLEPTEDLAGLNKRRESVGLPTIEQYKLALSALYKRPVK